MPSKRLARKAKPAAPAPPNADAFRLLFDNHPVPMWVYDLESLAFLEVNEAAVEKYGYSRNEFLTLTLKAIRPPEDVVHLPAEVKQERPPLQHSGEWRHRLKDGRIIDVEIAIHTIEFSGREAALVMAHDLTARKQAEEEALRESEARSRQTLDNMLEGCMLIGFDWTYLYVNESAARHGHEKRESLRGRTMLEKYPGVEDTVVFAHYRRCMVERIPQRFQAPYTFPDGPTHWFEFSIEPTPAGIFVLSLDITERKRAEQALRESEEIQRLVLENVEDVIYLIEVDPGNLLSGRVRFVSPRVENILGYKPEEFFDTEFWVRLVHPDDTRALAEQTTAILTAGVPGIRQYRLRHKATGEYRWMEDHVVPQINAAGQVVGQFGVARDITARVQAEATLRQREAFYHALVEHSYDAVTLIDSAGRRIYNSRSLLRISGRAREETIGQNFAEVVHPDDLPAAADAFAQLLKSPGLTLQTQLRIRTTDGTWRWVEATGTNLLGNPAVGAIVVNYRDITARVQADRERDEILEQVRVGRERLQSLSQQLLDVQEAERRRIALELHDEIGQTLTGLRLSLELPARLPVEAATARLALARTMVDELLRYVENLALDLRPAVLDDLGLLPALLWHFERYRVRTGVRVNCKHTGLDRRFPPEIETAAFRIVQEALTNTARHARVGDVTVRLWATPETLGLQVEDGGSGFDPEAALSTGATSGLSGMRERALLSGGHFEIESEPGNGTRLAVELPLGSPLDKREQPR